MTTYSRKIYENPQSLQFNGLATGSGGSYVAISPALTGFTTLLSIVSWVKISSVEGGGTGNYGGILAGINNNAGANRLLIQGDFKTILFQINGGTNATYTNATSLQNQWHLYGCTYDGTKMQIYLDGAAVGTPTSTTVTMNSSTTGTTIGWGSPTVYHLGGKIGDTAVWNVALTAANMTSIYSSGIDSVSTRPVNRWRLNEGTGSTAYDYAGSSNGTLTNSPPYTSDVPTQPGSYTGILTTDSVARKLMPNIATEIVSVSSPLLRTVMPLIAPQTISVTDGSGFTSGFTSGYQNQPSVLRKAMPKIATQTIAVSNTTPLRYITRSVTNTVAATGLLLRKPMPALAAQTVPVSSSLARTVRFVRGITETTNIPPDHLTRKAKPALASQTTSITDHLTRKAIPKIAAETVTVSPGSIARKLMPKLAAQTTVVGDSLSRLAHFFRAISNTTSISDGINRKIVRPIAAQTISIGDLLLRKPIPKIAAQTISVSDGIAKVRRAIRNISDTVSVSEFLGIYLLRQIAAQFVSISDSISAHKLPSGPIHISVSDTVAISDGIKRLIKRPIPVFTMYDNFEGGPYSYGADNQTSVNGKWHEVFLSGGTAGVRSSSGGTHAGSLVTWEKPTAAVGSSQTFSTLITTTTTYGNFTLELDMRTIQQLRTGASPNNSETAWINWHWTDSSHLYYFALKMSGVELGKIDTGGTQIVLDTPATAFTLTLNQWYHVKVIANGNHFQCYVDGTLYSDYRDIGAGSFAPTAALYSGKAALYCKDSEVEFDNVSITPLEGAAIIDSPAPFAPLIRAVTPKLAAQTVSISDSLTRTAHFFRTLTQTVAVSDSLGRIAKHFRTIIEPIVASYYEPLYIYPNWWVGSPWSWTPIINAISANPTVKFFLTLNVNSGPDVAVNADYTNGISQLQAAATGSNLILLGYVATQYGAKTQANVQTEIDNWFSFYPTIQGIMLDEMASVTGFETYYTNITAYAHTNHTGCQYVWGNPGNATISSYVNTVDVLTVFENAGPPPTESTIQTITFNGAYSRTKFHIVVHDQTTLPDRNYVMMASKYVNWLFFTDGTGTTPYAQFPTYMTQELVELQPTNQILDHIVRILKPKLVAQTVTVSDSLSRLAHFFRSLSDTTLLSESIVRTAKKFMTVSDAVAIGDALARHAHFFRSLSPQTTSISDALLMVKGKFISLSQTVVISDSLVKSSVFRRTVSGSVTISDTVKRKISRPIQQQTVSISDSITRFKGKHFTLFETVFIADVLKRKAVPKLAAENTTVTDFLRSVATNLGQQVIRSKGAGYGFAGAGERVNRPVRSPTFTKDWTMAWRKRVTKKFKT